jgi:Flp pilus assembly protein TadD
VNLGIAAHGLGDLDKARRAYLDAIRIAPRESSPYYYYARFQGDTGDPAGAVATLEVARRLAPEEARIPSLLGQNLVKLGRTDEARVAFQAALAIDPADAAARRGLDGLAAGPR